MPPDTDDKNADAGKNADADADAGKKPDTDADADAGKKPDADPGAGDLQDDLLSSKVDVQEILDEFGLDSPDDLKGFVGKLSEMRGKIGDNDLDMLLENTKTLNKYQAEWQRQDEEKRREKETPEETIARLSKEKDQAVNHNKTQSDKKKASQAAKVVLEEFESTIDSVIKTAKDLPESYRPMFRKFMGIGNPINEVDITDKAALRRLTKSSMKEMQNFAQEVIKDYRAGKIKIPNVDPVVPASADAGKGKEPKNLKEAKAIMMESAAAFTQKR